MQACPKLIWCDQTKGARGKLPWFTGSLESDGEIYLYVSWRPEMERWQVCSPSHGGEGGATVAWAKTAEQGKEMAQAMFEDEWVQKHHKQESVIESLIT